MAYVCSSCVLQLNELYNVVQFVKNIYIMLFFVYSHHDSFLPLS